MPPARPFRYVALHSFIFAFILLPFFAPSLSCQAQPSFLPTSAGLVQVNEVGRVLDHPWGMAFLPDGRLLVTERSGALRILARNGTLSPPVEGTPKVFNEGQGGLLDVALDPEFEKNGLVYLSFAEPGEGGASTALGRGRLEGRRLNDFEVIFHQLPKVEGAAHFGSRILFLPDHTLFLTLGERFTFDPAQELSNHLGKTIRITRDGKAPPDNPFVGRKSARKEIWTYGHRNIEAAAIHPVTKEIWIGEMGPKGGDELNIIRKGQNYGWPVVSWGEHYDGKSIPKPPTHPGFADAVRHWTPVISPCGMIFYTGTKFPAWRGSMFIGGLTSQELVRLEIEGQNVLREERLAMGARIRDVEQSPEGDILVLTDKDDGGVWRLSPEIPVMELKE